MRLVFCSCPTNSQTWDGNIVYWKGARALAAKFWTALSYRPSFSILLVFAHQAIGTPLLPRRTLPRWLFCRRSLLRWRVGSKTAPDLSRLFVILRLVFLRSKKNDCPDGICANAKRTGVRCGLWRNAEVRCPSVLPVWEELVPNCFSRRDLPRSLVLVFLVSVWKRFSLYRLVLQRLWLLALLHCL